MSLCRHRVSGSAVWAATSEDVKQVHARGDSGLSASTGVGGGMRTTRAKVNAPGDALNYGCL